MKGDSSCSISVFLAAVLISVSFSFCHRNEPFDAITPDPNNPAMGKDHDPDLVGIWECHISHEEAGDYENIIRHIYNSNGTWECYESYWDDEGGEGRWWSRGHWATNDGILYKVVTNSIDKKDLGNSYKMSYQVHDEGLDLGNGKFFRVKH